MIHVHNTQMTYLPRCGQYRTVLWETTSMDLHARASERETLETLFIMPQAQALQGWAGCWVRSRWIGQFGKY
jgi:hypothetical protein